MSVVIKDCSNDDTNKELINKLTNMLNDNLNNFILNNSSYSIKFDNNINCDYDLCFSDKFINTIDYTGFSLEIIIDDDNYKDGHKLLANYINIISRTKQGLLNNKLYQKIGHLLFEKAANLKRPTMQYYVEDRVLQLKIFNYNWALKRYFIEDGWAIGASINLKLNKGLDAFTEFEITQIVKFLEQVVESFLTKNDGNGTPDFSQFKDNGNSINANGAQNMGLVFDFSQWNQSCTIVRYKLEKNGPDYFKTDQLTTVLNDNSKLLKLVKNPNQYLKGMIVNDDLLITKITKIF